KGLEFDVVFITGLEEGLFPHENSILEAAGLEEERRLMYVAITRARERLYLTLAQSRMLHGQTRYALRSRFLEEIPDEHVKWLSPREATHVSKGMDAWSGAFRRGRGFGASGASLTPAAPRSVTTGVTVGNQQFRIGAGVRHARFGEGTVVSLSGNGTDAQAQIQFREAGLKTLALGIGRLEVIAWSGRARRPVDLFHRFAQLEPRLLKRRMLLAELAVLAQHAQAFVATLVTVQPGVGHHGVQFGQPGRRSLHLCFHLLQPLFKRHALFGAPLAALRLHASLRPPIHNARGLGLGVAFVAFLAAHTATVVGQPVAVVLQVAVELAHPAFSNDPETVHGGAQQMAVMGHQQHAAAKLRQCGS